MLSKHTRAEVAHACFLEAGAYGAEIVRDNGEWYDISPDRYFDLSGRQEWLVGIYSGLSQGGVDEWTCFRCFMNFTGNRCTAIDPYVDECSFWW